MLEQSSREYVWSESRARAAKFDQFGPYSCQRLPKGDPTWPDLGQHWPSFDRFLPILTASGRKLLQRCSQEHCSSMSRAFPPFSCVFSGGECSGEDCSSNLSRRVPVATGPRDHCSASCRPSVLAGCLSCRRGASAVAGRSRVACVCMCVCAMHGRPVDQAGRDGLLLANAAPAVFLGYVAALQLQGGVGPSCLRWGGLPQLCEPTWGEEAGMRSRSERAPRQAGGRSHRVAADRGLVRRPHTVRVASQEPPARPNCCRSGAHAPPDGDAQLGAAVREVVR